MTLIDMIHKIVQETVSAMQMTEYVPGTVVSASPLEISINPAMAPLKPIVLIMTSGVGALEQGDRVTLLRVARGQKFIVLSKEVSV